MWSSNQCIYSCIHWYDARSTLSPISSACKISLHEQYEAARDMTRMTSLSSPWNITKGSLNGEAHLVIDFGPEEDKQGVRREKEQSWQIQQDVLQSLRFYFLNLQSRINIFEAR